MSRHLRLLVAACLALALAPAALWAQEPATITGRTTNASGEPEPAVQVRIAALSVGAVSDAQGRYTLVVPAARLRAARSVAVTAQRVGLGTQTRTVTLNPGGSLTLNFVMPRDALQLSAIVATGGGIQTRVERMGTTRASVDSSTIVRTNEPNLVTALAGKVPNVITTQSSGEPGASTAIRIRGTSTLSGTGQPLFVIDGVPMNNNTRNIGNSPLQGTVAPNRASDINPADIESIEILKGPAATSIYGAQAGAGGAILITTKRGRAGRTTYSLRSSVQLDNASNTLPMQSTYGLGSNNVSPTCKPGGAVNCQVSSGFFSWGPALAAGTPTYDHSSELYNTGRIFDNSLTMSGGTERTTFYLSTGVMRHNGYIVGDRDSFNRYTARLNASHRLVENLTVGGAASYVQTDGEFVQRGNSINGLLLGSLRSPPEFNNKQYLDPTTGLHRSYRFPNPGPTAFRTNRGFDNPFYALNESENSGKTGRVLGNVYANWLPLTWLRVDYTLGADYANDDRIEAVGEASSGAAAGGIVARWQFYDQIIDHNLVATANWKASSTINGTLSAGQNLNQRSFRQIFVTGRDLVAPRPFKLANTVTRDAPSDVEQRDRLESYLLNATVDVADQLFLTGGVTNFGSSRFGTQKRAWYPRAQAAWTFSRTLGIPETSPLQLGKLRLAYGESGQLPDYYLQQDVFTNLLLTDFNPGSQLIPTLNGLGGLYTSATRGNPDIKPERVGELEGGIDLALFDGRATLAMTHYRSQAEDVIFSIPLAPSTGFGFRTLNAAKIRNRGWEVEANFTPIRTRAVEVEFGANWARNRNKLLSLGDSNTTVAGYFQAQSFGGRTTNAVVGEPLGVFRGTDFARCGRGLTTIGGNNIAAACEGKPDGALYISPSGFPVADLTDRTIGDPNPDWTGGLNAAVTVRGVRMSAFLDRRSGGTNQNMTRASLYSYGTHGDTEARATCSVVGGSQVCTGNEKVFGGSIMPGPVVGPGAGKPVPIGENWYNSLGGIGGPSAQFQEDASFTRLREVSLSYTMGQPWVKRRLGVSSIDLRVAGRNLKTWTNYTGYDPEVHLGGAAVGNRGIDWFVEPVSRGWVFSVGINN
jgi:TonB-linked SusC/RagA family outer membrane protein